MKTRHKIAIIVTTIPFAFFGMIIFGPIFLMTTTNAYAGFVMSSTSNQTFEEEFAKIPEVKLFIEKYPEYTTSHSSDFLGWKVIFYDAKISDDKSIHLHVKKSMIHQGVRVNAGCSDGSFSFAYDIPQEQVMNYLRNDKCATK